jgi:hypothetical protein
MVCRLPYFFGDRNLFHLLSSFGVSDGNATVFDEGADSCSSEESGDASAGCPKFFSQGALWSQFHFDFAAEELFFEDGIFAHIGDNEFLDLLVLKQDS